MFTNSPTSLKFKISDMIKTIKKKLCCTNNNLFYRISLFKYPINTVSLLLEKIFTLHKILLSSRFNEYFFT